MKHPYNRVPQLEAEKAQLLKTVTEQQQLIIELKLRIAALLIELKQTETAH